MQITNHSFPSKSYHNNSYHSFSKHFSFSHSRTNYIYYIFIIIIYIVKFYLTFSFPSDTPSVKTVITVIVIAVITLDALKQCIKVEDKIHKSPNESSTNHRIKVLQISDFFKKIPDFQFLLVKISYLCRRNGISLSSYRNLMYIRHGMSFVISELQFGNKLLPN